MTFRDMNNDEIAILKSLTKMDVAELNGMYNVILRMSGPMKMLAKMAPFANLHFDQAVQIFIVACSNGAIGVVRSYLDHITEWSRKNKIHAIDLDVFCREIFPDGLPVFKRIKN